MNIGYAALSDLDYLVQNDEHVTAVILKEKIARQEIVTVSHARQPVGWLRFNYFWDEHPFMNMLALAEEYRGRGWGRALVSWWEAQMQARGYCLVMTSTQSDEAAQHFYRGLGYHDCGALLLPDEPLEIILMKRL